MVVARRTFPPETIQLCFTLKWLFQATLLGRRCRSLARPPARHRSPSCRMQLRRRLQNIALIVVMAELSCCFNYVLTTDCHKSHRLANCCNYKADPSTRLPTCSFISTSVTEFVPRTPDSIYQHQRKTSVPSNQSSVGNVQTFHKHYHGKRLEERDSTELGFWISSAYEKDYLKVMIYPYNLFSHTNYDEEHATTSTTTTVCQAAVSLLVLVKLRVERTHVSL